MEDSHTAASASAVIGFDSEPTPCAENLDALKSLLSISGALLIESVGAAAQAMQTQSSLQAVAPIPRSIIQQHLGNLDQQCLANLAQNGLQDSERLVVAGILGCIHPLSQAVVSAEEILIQAPRFYDPKSNAHKRDIPCQMPQLGSVIHALVQQSLESLLSSDVLLAQAVLSKASWIAHLSLGTRSRLARILLEGKDNIEWAENCFSVLNGWEEIAGSAMAIAGEVLIIHGIPRSPASHPTAAHV